MLPSRCTYPFALLALLAVATGCDSFDPETNQFAVINISAVAAGEGYTASPAAFFFEGSSIRLSTTEVGAEGCVDRAIVTTPVEAFAFIDAGPSVGLSHAGQVVSLVPEISGGRVTYELPGNEAIAITPGGGVTISIPGAVGGFPATLLGTQTVPAFTPGAVTMSRSGTGSLDVSWQNSEAIVPGSAMFYSLKYAGANSSQIDREIACVFVDDGDGEVAASELAGFRASEVHSITAQRARITIERLGSAIAHVTSALSIPVDLFIED